MHAGKLPPDLLEDLLRLAPTRDARVVLGPAVGEDAALVRFGRRLLVAKTDPITFATDAIGWYAVQVNANDVATLGARPRWFLASVLLPEGAPEALAWEVFRQIGEACRRLGAVLVGGHTEVTVGLGRPIVVGCMLGEVLQGREVTTRGARVGDLVLLTKGIAIEGTAVLAREAAEALHGAGVPRRLVARAREFIYRPGIGVVQEALLACKHAKVHCMHDPTEGGLATGLWEVARAAGVGMLVHRERIPVLEETAAVCNALGLDPLGLLASGSLVLTAAPAEAHKVLAALEGRRIPVRIIGEVRPPEEGVRLRSAEGEVPLPTFPRDELARFLSGGASTP